MASLTHQWLLCLFATEVVRILYHCCLPLPSNLHFHFLPSALLPPPPPLTTCCSLLSKDVKPVTPYHFGLWPQSCEYACAVCPYTQLFVCHLTSQQTGIFRNKVPIETLWTLLLISISHVFRLQDFSFFVVFSFSFCFVPVRMYQQAPEMQVLSTTRFSLWTIAVDTCICFLFFFSLLISGSTKALV